MHKVTIVGKDWGFFASSLSQNLRLRGVRVKKRFAPNGFLGPVSGSPLEQSLVLLQRELQRIQKVPWLWGTLRTLGNLVSLAWWVTGIIGSKVIVVSGVPTLFQSWTFMSLCRALGKQVVLCVHGSDGRPPFLNGLRHSDITSKDTLSLAKYVLKFRTTVKTAALQSASVISWMGCSHYLPGTTYLFEEVGFPVVPPIPKVDSRTLPKEESNGEPDRPLRLLHAPSSQGKGSDEIRRVIEDLLEEGWALSLEQLSGRPNIEILAALEQADLIIDQVYSDNFAGVFAREAGLRSCWVIVGGESLNRMRLAGWEPPPVLISSVEQLKKDLRWCAENRDLLTAKGEVLQQFLQRENFTGFFLSAFLDTNPQGDACAKYKPRKPYLEFHPGFGGYASREVINEMLEAAVRAAGTRGLGFPKWFSDELFSYYATQSESGPTQRHQGL